jgi:hypothetical protein
LVTPNSSDATFLMQVVIPIHMLFASPPSCQGTSLRTLSLNGLYFLALVTTRMCYAPTYRILHNEIITVQRKAWWHGFKKIRISYLGGRKINYDDESSFRGSLMLALVICWYFYCLFLCSDNFTFKKHIPSVLFLLSLLSSNLKYVGWREYVGPLMKYVTNQSHEHGTWLFLMFFDSFHFSRMFMMLP